VSFDDQYKREMLIRSLASVFGLIFAAFANIGQTHLVFTVNAVSNTHGSYRGLSLTRFRPLQHWDLLSCCSVDSHRKGVRDTSKNKFQSKALHSYKLGSLEIGATCEPRIREYESLEAHSMRLQSSQNISACSGQTVS
jgi:hypothetical protein